MEADREWIYAVDGARHGPVSAGEIATLISTDRLPVKTLVWKPGLAAWTPATDVPEILGLCAPSLPQEAQPAQATSLTAVPEQASVIGGTGPPGARVMASTQTSRMIWWWSLCFFLAFTGLVLRQLGDRGSAFAGWLATGAGVALVVGRIRQTRWWMVPLGALGGFALFACAFGILSLVTRSLPTTSVGPAAVPRDSLAPSGGAQALLPLEEGRASQPAVPPLLDRDAEAIAGLAVLNDSWHRWFDGRDAMVQGLMRTGQRDPAYSDETFIEQIRIISAGMSASSATIEDGTIRQALEALARNYSSWAAAEGRRFTRLKEQTLMDVASGRSGFRLPEPGSSDPDAQAIKECLALHPRLVQAVLMSLEDHSKSQLLERYLRAKGLSVADLPTWFR